MIWRKRKFGRKIIKRIYSFASVLIYRSMPGLELGQRITFHGKPIIDICNGGKVIIQDDVLLNSVNRGYHVNMFSPVKLFADRPGATITIGKKTRIHGSCLHAYCSISIGQRCLIAANCQIIDGSGHALSFNNVEDRLNTKGDCRPIIIEDDVWIGTNTIILPGVRIGKGSIIGAGSVLNKNIPPMAIVQGNPAKFIRFKK
ncbi:MAG: acyltransferase [Chrysiogenia bacterium]